MDAFGCGWFKEMNVTHFFHFFGMIDHITGMLSTVDSSYVVLLVLLVSQLKISKSINLFLFRHLYKADCLLPRFICDFKLSLTLITNSLFLFDFCF